MRSISPTRRRGLLAYAIATVVLVSASTCLADSPKPEAASKLPAQAQLAAPQTPVTPKATLSTAPMLIVTAENGKTMTLDAAALSKLPQQTVHAEAHGKTVNCTGPALIDVLGLVGTFSGEALRGKNLALYVRASAADDYRAVFSLAELDPGISGDGIPIVTATCDGSSLDAKDGPLRIVAPRDKRPARWVRQLTALTVFRAS